MTITVNEAVAFGLFGFILGGVVMYAVLYWAIEDMKAKYL